MVNQEKLRQMVKYAKASDDIKYKDIAQDILNMNVNSFYNWLNGKAKLSRSKVIALFDFIINFQD